MAVMLFLLSIVAAALSRLLADELKGWMHWLVERLIRRAVVHLPANYQPRLAEEWRSHINDVPGQVGRVIVALGCLVAAGSLSFRKNTLLWASPRFQLVIGLQFLLAVAVAVALGSNLHAQTLVPWLMVIAAADAVFLVNLRVKHRLKMCRCYLAFVVGGGAIQLICYSVQPSICPTTFWVAAIAQNVLLCGLMGELAFYLLPHQYVRQSAASILLVVTILFVRQVPGGAGDAIWGLSLSAVYVTLIVPLVLWIVGQHWDRELEAATGSCMLVLLGETLPALLHASLPQIAMGKLCLLGQFIDLVAMLLLGIGTTSIERPRGKAHPGLNVSLPA